MFLKDKRYTFSKLYIPVGCGSKEYKDEKHNNIMLYNNIKL